MIKRKSVLAIIPARGGSKRIPRKNVASLGGKPLIGWTIEQAKMSKFIDTVIVSTDDRRIADVSMHFNAEVPFLRPGYLSTDRAPSHSVVAHALHWMESKSGRWFDLFVLLQPTSPFRTRRHIDEAIATLSRSDGADSVVSVARVHENPYWMKVVDREGFLVDFVKSKQIVARRQDLPTVYMPNGAIYVGRVKEFSKSKNLESNGIPYVMDSSSSVDIDEPDDLAYAEYILRKHPMLRSR